MDAEQTQSEGVLPGGEEKALEALRWDWDTAYLIGYDEEHGWYAGRRDRIGELITADDPDALRRKIAENYAIKPVPARAAPTGGDPDPRARPGHRPRRADDSEHRAVMWTRDCSAAGQCAGAHVTANLG
jgi:hypothetical protein